jgi:uncharacterized protein YfaT (DUF1175 family)
VAHDRLRVLAANIQPDRLEADGHESAVLTIQSSTKSSPAQPPTITFEGRSLGVIVDSIEHAGNAWRARIRPGILPGHIAMRIDSPGYRPAAAQLTTVLDEYDSAGDGTPDFMRLDDPQDQKAFRDWFVWLAEAQYFLPPAARRREIDDCAALIRFAYREALRAHNNEWIDSIGLPEYPAFDSVEKYQYPATPLAAALFRVRAGPFQAGDLHDGAFLQFADAQTLWRFNAHLVSRDVSRALPGDLLFFRRQSSPVTFHGMIYVGKSKVGESKVRPDGHRYLLYHTGPTGSDPGEIRRPTVEELMRFPQPEWRPIAANPSFLGVFRWNILWRSGNDAEAELR